MHRGGVRRQPCSALRTETLPGQQRPVHPPPRRVAHAQRVPVRQRPRDGQGLEAQHPPQRCGRRGGASRRPSPSLLGTRGSEPFALPLGRLGFGPERALQLQSCCRDPHTPPAPHGCFSGRRRAPSASTVLPVRATECWGPELRRSGRSLSSAGLCEAPGPPGPEEVYRKSGDGLGGTPSLPRLGATGSRSSGEVHVRPGCECTLVGAARVGGAAGVGRGVGARSWNSVSETWSSLFGW